MKSARPSRAGRLLQALALLALAPPTFAELDPGNPFEVLDVRVRVIAGIEHLEVSGLMNGSIPGLLPGSYRVPLTVVFPRDRAEQSGTAVVDFLNNTAFKLFFQDLFDPGAPSETPAVPPFPIARLMLGEEFLARRGDTYAAIQHDKQAIEMYEAIGRPVGHGAHIDSTLGENTVIADVAELLEDPPAALLTLGAASHTIAFGESASASDLSEHFFELDFPSSFDGVLLQSACGLACGPPPADKKFILVNSETDVQIGGAALSRPGFLGPPNYRVYEVAGAAHNPLEQIDVEELALAFDPAYLATLPDLRQNPAPLSPVVRAMYDHLRRWIAGGAAPPPSVFLDGPGPPRLEVLPGLLGGRELREVTDPFRDRDGNALGGVRLPHVLTWVGGNSIGAPLGTLNGLERQAPSDSRGFGILISGTLEVFPPSTLALRYATPLVYVGGVQSAADHALSKGWITAEDRQAYLQDALACASVVNPQLTYEEAVQCLDP